MYETQIAAGIDFLESEGIDWRAQLRGKPLDMGRGLKLWGTACCVIAHLYGSYGEYVTKNNKTNRWGVEHGFAVDMSDIRVRWERGEVVTDEWFRIEQERYAVLTREWLEVIHAADVPDHVPADVTAQQTPRWPLPALVLTGTWRG